MWSIYGVEGCYDTPWLRGLWFTQAKLEGTVLKATWHCGTDSSVVDDSHVEPGRTTLYVIIPYVWGSVDGDC